MKETVSKKAILNLASIAGLALGAVSSAHLLITENISAWIPSTAVVSILNMLLWIAKFLGCIYLMRYFMLKLTREYEQVNNQHTMRLGVWAASFSALVYATVSLADLMFIKPDSLDEAYNMAMSLYSNNLDSNTLKAMEEVRGSLPMITFFSNLIYCIIYGVLLSAILSRGIPRMDPFAAFRKHIEAEHIEDQEAVVEDADDADEEEVDEQ